MRPFKSVENVRPGKSVFDLSYSKLLSADMGLLYPIMCDEMVPGDSFNVNHSIVARVMPLVPRILNEINITVHTFFVPYRLLWEDWEDFITGGIDGDNADTLPRMDYPGDVTFEAGNSLWDYLGFPHSITGTVTASDTLPLQFPQLAYSMIWNEYYRDETLQTEIDLATPSDTLLRRCWTKDYFTSALLWAQRGTPPALPLSGTAPVSDSVGGMTGDVIFNFANLDYSNPWYNTNLYAHDPVGGEYPVSTQAPTQPNGSWNRTSAPKDPVATIDYTNVSADMSLVSTFDINDIRLAWQIQRWMERNARSGVRYTEFLQAHFGVGGNLDARLQRPEYVGGLKAPVIISEVLQTSETTVGGTPQGNLAGHGITVSREHIGKYYAQEYGLIMSLLSIMPKPMYSQGINRQWLRRSRYDFYFPEFSTLGEQAVEDAEIYWQDTDALNEHVFGFQQRYDEMRYKPNLPVCMLRPGADFDYWTLTREFGSLPALDDTFVTCDPDPRSWAVQVDAPQFVIHVGNHIKAVRPIPYMGTPGLVDHH